MKQALSKEEIVRRIEKASEAEDLYPGILGRLGNPVAFASRWGLPLSKSYLKFKERELRAAKSARTSAARKNGASKAHRTSDK